MRWLWAGLRALFIPRLQLLAEIACLCQQLALYRRRYPHPRLKDRDRRFWILMARGFPGWKECLLIVTPATVLRWHRKGWQYYWRWRSGQRRVGRRRIPLATRELIRRLARENPRTVRRYMRRRYTGPPAPRWKDFLKQHAQDIWACDFLTVRTLTFQTLYVFFLIHHASRAIVHVRATRHPTSAWVGQQLVNACFDRRPPKYLIRDRDSIYGQAFSRKARVLEIRDICTPVRSPQANAIAERFVGTLRRECLDHVFVFNEQHLQKVVAEFTDYYNRHRPHRSLGHRPPCPVPATPSPASTGTPPRVIAEAVLGGLHHVYHKAA